MTHLIEFEQWVPFPVEQVFRFFANPENLPRIMPAASHTRVDSLRLVAPPPDPRHAQDMDRLAGAGSEIHTAFRILPPLPFRARWVAAITEFAWNRYFVDVQRKGPFRSWNHRHQFRAQVQGGVEGTVVRDVVQYELPLGVVGRVADRLLLSRQIRKTFLHRRRALDSLLRAATGASGVR